jgi:hypothetical protein
VSHRRAPKLTNPSPQKIVQSSNVRKPHRTQTPRISNAPSRPPPAQPSPHPKMARPPRRRHPALQPSNLGLQNFRRSRRAPHPNLGPILSPTNDPNYRRHALRHPLEPLRRPLDRRPSLRPPKTRPPPPRRDPRPRRSRTQLHRESSASRSPPPHHSLRLKTQWRTAHRRSRLPRAPGGPAPLRLEKRQMGPRPRIPRPRRARFLGAKRLQHVRRPIQRRTFQRISEELWGPFEILAADNFGGRNLLSCSSGRQ